MKKHRLTFNSYESYGGWGSKDYFTHIFLDKEYVASMIFSINYERRERDKEEQSKYPVLEKVETLLSHMFKNTKITTKNGKEKFLKNEKCYVVTLDVEIDETNKVEIALEKLFNELKDADSFAGYGRIMKSAFHKVETKNYGDGIAREAELKNINGNEGEMEVSINKYLSEKRHKKTNKLLKKPDYKTNLEEYLPEVREELKKHVLNHTGVEIEITNNPTYEDFKTYDNKQATYRGNIIFKFKAKEIVDEKKFLTCFSDGNLKSIIAFNLLTNVDRFKKDFVEFVKKEPKNITLRNALERMDIPGYLYKILEYEKDFLNDENSINKFRSIFFDRVISDSHMSSNTLALRNIQKLMPKLYEKAFGNVNPFVMSANYKESKERNYHNYETPKML